MAMTNEEIRDYTARISQANRSELVVILFDLFRYSVDRAEEAFKENNKEDADKYLKKAQDCVVELKGSLNFKYEISYKLDSLYRYVHEQIILSIVRREPVNFPSIREVMDGLAESFEKIAQSDNSETVMSNSQQVYAGLTYGKDSLNEVFMNSNEASRGFKA